MDDLSSRTLRELLTLARERLGRAAAGLKTREELISALRGEASAQQPRSKPEPTQRGTAELQAGELVTRDFFVARP
ncbi:MAG: hypothetical protein AB1938_27550 [Myxococcota bacterium]